MSPIPGLLPALIPALYPAIPDTSGLTRPNLQDRELVKKRQEARVRLAGALN